MRSLVVACVVAAACAGMAPACGGKVVFDAGATASGSGGASASASATSSASSCAGGAGMCNLPPAPSPIPPTTGCASNDDGKGWVSIPCLCELWLRNTELFPIEAGIHVLESGAPPTLDGSVDIELAFEDADGSAFAAWSNQTGNGSTFRLAHDTATTTVRLGTTDLTLAPIPVAACTTRKAKSTITGTISSEVDFHVTLEGGKLMPVDAKCFNPPTP